ncbi:TLDc domain-containing protein, partial [Syncephalis fuscata]
RLSRRWSLLYSLDQHGISFTTMLNRVENKGPIILAIQDEENKIFGGYATESFKPHIGCYGSDQDPSNGKDKLEVYSWTGKNDYSIMTEPNYIAMGVDNGKFGLWIDSSFDNGSSMPCATFDNPQLSTHETFTCAHIEIWALQ